MTEYKKKELDSASEKDFFKPTNKHKKERVFWSVLLLSIAYVAFLYFYIESQKIITASPSDTVKEHERNIKVAKEPICDDEPPHDKSYYILNTSLIGRSDLTYSKLKINNEYNYHVVMQLSSVGNMTPYAMVSVLPNSKASVSLPLGNYEVEIKAGSLWCNREVGFSDGEIIKVSDQLAIANEITQEITIASKGPALRDIHLELNKGGLDFINKVTSNQIDGYGVTEILQSNNGGYYINGSINKYLTTFQVDTGASTTSIPKELADIVGVTNCKTHRFNTANGEVVGCIGIVPELTFGNFRITNVEIAVMPNMKGSLLGMNVLSNLRLESSVGLMRLTLNQ